MYIVTPFHHVKRHFENLSLVSTKKWTAQELTKLLRTQRPGAHFCAREQARVPAPFPNSSVGTWQKGCVHISAQRVPYSGTVPGHQVWTLPIFAAWNTAIVVRHIRRSRTPLYQIAQFEKDTSSESEDIPPQSCEHLQPFVWWGKSVPPHTNVCKISQLCGGISLLVSNKSLSI